MNNEQNDELKDAMVCLSVVKSGIDDMRPAYTTLRPDSTLDMRNGVRNLYYAAIRTARDIDKSPHVHERPIEQAFYEAVDVLAYNDYKPKRIRTWLSPDYMERDDYTPPGYDLNTHIIRENPHGNREEMIVWIDDIRQSLAKQQWVDDVSRMTLYALNKADSVMWHIHPQNERKRRMDAHLNNRQILYNRDNYRAQFINIW